jgi:predicted GIY-YIG superfamily endonuclease
MHPYVVYVVFAWVQQSNGNCIKTYIGITNNLTQRLRKHRGELTGGAKFTKRYSKTGAEWKLAGLLHGFESHQQVLQVEWALQNPCKSRHFKHRERTGKHNLAGILSNLIYFSTLKDYSELWPTLHSLPTQTRQDLQIQKQVDLHCNPEPTFYSSIEYQKFVSLHRPTLQQRSVTSATVVVVKREKLTLDSSKTSSRRVHAKAPTPKRQPNQNLIQKLQSNAQAYLQQLQQLERTTRY